MIVKTNHEGGDEIKFLPQVGQGPKRLDLLNDTADGEQARYLAKHWQAIDVETKAAMAEQLCDIEKIPRTTAQIENALRA